MTVQPLSKSGKCEGGRRNGCLTLFFPLPTSHFLLFIGCPLIPIGCFPNSLFPPRNLERHAGSDAVRALEEVAVGVKDPAPVRRPAIDLRLGGDGPERVAFLDYVCAVWPRSYQGGASIIHVHLRRRDLLQPAR